MTHTVDVNQLAESVHGWLERKQLASLAPVFSEALLTYAAAKYLVEQGYEITAEENLGTGPADYRSCDLVARNPDMKANGLAFEFKFLKGRNTGAPTQPFERISNDILKLCCLGQEWHAYLVLGYAASTKLYKELTKEPLRFAIDDVGLGTLKPRKALERVLSLSGISACSLLREGNADRGDMRVSIFRIEVHHR
ncbi:hypothetical protein IVB22_08350 [Bradyrhizobium sp. 190]|uniref:hypothetical protein n=1 Tax=Bradyrhizobium sp. 190 TaxID=2782658 RepID=UPI001FF80585|nr:hypothetical protein [Bradyrhizobium sp. 190]MCK1512588.1 hypothetical protein [Bradyrhizobium sp. 190]